MVNEVVSGYSTHKESHSSFYKSYYRNDDFFPLLYVLIVGLEHSAAEQIPVVCDI